MNDNISIRISFLRILLIIQVVIIHCYGFFTNPIKKDYNFLVQNYFSNILSRSAVPLFFIISAYLFFIKTNKLSFQEYKITIKKKTITLFVPHIFWNITYLFIFFLLHISLNFPYPFSFNSIFDALWGISREPVAYQFWFIRDLFTLTLLYPLLLILDKYLGISLAIFWGLVWLLNIPIQIFYLWNESIFFFVIGLQIAKRQDILYKNNMSSIAIYFLLSLVDLSCQIAEYEYSIIVHRFVVLFGVLAFWNLTNLIYPFINNKRNSILYYSKLSFGIFALHQPIIVSSLKKISLLIASRTSEYTLLPLYLFVILLAILISLSLTLLLKRIFPKLNYIFLGK